MGALPVSQPPVGNFIRGDANDDGAVDLADAVRVLIYLFKGNIVPACLDALDADDSGLVDVTDAVDLLRYLFKRGPAPPAPFPAPGADPTAGDPYHCGGGSG